MTARNRRQQATEAISAIGEGPPHQRHTAAERQQIGCREQDDHLADKGNEHAVDAVAQGLEHRRDHDAETCKEEADAQGAQSRDADLQHVFTGFKQQEEFPCLPLHQQQAQSIMATAQMMASLMVRVIRSFFRAP